MGQEYEDESKARHLHVAQPRLRQTNFRVDCNDGPPFDKPEPDSSGEYFEAPKH